MAESHNECNACIAERDGRIAADHCDRWAAALVAAGCSVRFLPRYSPDLNPIEPAFAKLKQALRRAEARSFDALVVAIGAATAAVTPADARAFFAAAGYPTTGHLL